MELIVDKLTDYRCDVILYMGNKPYYGDSVLSSYYIKSHDKEIKIYSGIESYFNLPNCPVFYGKAQAIHSNDSILLWIIHMYKDSVVDVYSTNYANPFLLLPASPKYWVDPIITENNESLAEE